MRAHITREEAKRAALEMQAPAISQGYDPASDQKSFDTAHKVSAFRWVMNYSTCRITIVPDRTTDDMFILITEEF